MIWDISLGGDLHIYGTIASCFAGYFNGYLLKDMGLYKIIAAIFIIPTCVQTLISLNDVISATLPFLLFALIAYLGIEKSKHYALEFIDFSHEVIKKRS